MLKWKNKHGEIAKNKRNYAVIRKYHKSSPSILFVALSFYVLFSIIMLFLVSSLNMHQMSVVIPIIHYYLVLARQLLLTENPLPNIVVVLWYTSSDPL